MALRVLNYLKITTKNLINTDKLAKLVRAVQFIAITGNLIPIFKFSFFRRSAKHSRFSEAAWNVKALTAFSGICFRTSLLVLLAGVKNLFSQQLTFVKTGFRK